MMMVIRARIDIAAVSGQSCCLAPLGRHGVLAVSAGTVSSGACQHQPRPGGASGCRSREGLVEGAARHFWPEAEAADKVERAETHGQIQTGW